MAKTIVVVGFGPGNSTAVAEKFGTEGFSVALVGRNEDRLAAGVSALKARGIAAAAFPADAAANSALSLRSTGTRSGVPRREIFSPPTRPRCGAFST